MNLFRLKLLAPVAVGVTAAAFAAGASAATSDVSSNWAGYVVSGTDQATFAPTTYTNVSGTWTQPAANCSTSAGTGSTSSAFWVGLGGDAEGSQALEQTGTEVDCSSNGVPTYSAWYELVPAASVKVKLKVAAGDRITGAVHVNGTQVTVSLKNLTRKTSFTKTLTMASPDLTSAEWIAEAPSACSNYGGCRQTSLTDFGTVKFSNATATSSDGHTGTISDPAWSADAVTLDTSGGSDPFSRFNVNQGSAQATPSTLSATGGAFSVAWASATPTTTDPSAGVYPGYGYGGGGFGYGGGFGI
jgi:Peptidase A4 family